MSSESEPHDKAFQRHGSERFYKMLAEMAELHDKKSHDYAADNNPFGNYHFAGFIANLFKHSSDDAGFAGRLAEKIFRLSVLEGGGKTPKNESIADTELDIAVIAVLWMADRQERRSKPKPPERNMFDAVRAMTGGQQDQLIRSIQEMQSNKQYDNPIKSVAYHAKDMMREEKGTPMKEVPIQQCEAQTLHLIGRINNLLNEYLRLPPAHS